MVRLLSLWERECIKYVQFGFSGARTNTEHKRTKRTQNVCALPSRRQHRRGFQSPFESGVPIQSVCARDDVSIRLSTT